MASASRTRYTAADVRQVLPYWDNFVDNSDASDMVIEVLCNHFCRRLRLFTIIRCGPWLSGGHCRCHRRQDRRDVVD